MTDPVRVQRGRLVRETWVTWAKRQRRPHDSWLIGWDALGAGQREVDMLIGDAVAEAERDRHAQELADRQRALERAEALLAERDRQWADALRENERLLNVVASRDRLIDGLQNELMAVKP
jgi:hypothetical protein